jgi:hypothetical protein
MTDIKIIKAFECLRGDALKCGECPYSPRYRFPLCQQAVAKDGIALFNRQKAEIEELTAEVETLQLDNDALRMAGNFLKMHYKKAEAEIEKLQTENRILKQKRLNLFERLELVENARNKAIKEVLERIKSKSQYTTDKIGKLQKVVYVEDIDKVKKEMVGDSE